MQTDPRRALRGFRRLRWGTPLVEHVGLAKLVLEVRRPSEDDAGDVYLFTRKVVVRTPQAESAGTSCKLAPRRERGENVSASSARSSPYQPR